MKVSLYNRDAEQFWLSVGIINELRINVRIKDPRNEFLRKQSIYDFNDFF